MSRLILTSVCCLLGCSALLRAQVPAQTPPDRPALVVSIVVDQMRYEYLQKFWNQFGTGGFRRLATEGFRQDACHYNYVPTETAPGHATIHTGATPSVHGIIGNAWWDPALAATHSSVADADHPRVGEGAHKGASPHYMLTTTLADELKRATDYKGISVGLSIKDRSAILPIGKSGDLAVWYDDASGKWISSTYYLENGALPAWLQAINATDFTTALLSKGWSLLKPASTYQHSDDASYARYEGSYYPDSLPCFPYHFQTVPFAGVNPGAVFRATPHGNSALEDLAEQAVVNLNLGADAHTDFLCVSFSSPDVIGHQFGPQSREVEDTYLRLDAEIADMLKFLDGRVKGKVLVFLTADHGAAENPLYAQDHGHEADFLKEDAVVMEHLNKAAGVAVVKAVYGHQVWLDDKTLETYKLDREEVAYEVANALMELAQVQEAYTATELIQMVPHTPAQQLLLNGFHPARSGDVLYISRPGYTDAGYSTSWAVNKGTSHGSPWAYDTHVPLLMWGWHVPPGRSAEPVVVPDIAPTVARLLGITEPSGCTGRVIEW